jgi:hypothetical protein
MAVAWASLEFMVPSDVSKHGMRCLFICFIQAAKRLLGVHLLFKLALYDGRAIALRARDSPTVACVACTQY